MRWAYNPKLKLLAQELRQNMTMGEILLWRHLKDSQRCGYDFHRQKPIDEYILDFFCSKLQLAIEIDGATHNFKMDQDRSRQDRLAKLGIQTLRFTEKDVLSNMEGVVSAIDSWIKSHPSAPDLTPSGSDKRNHLP